MRSPSAPRGEGEIARQLGRDDGVDRPEQVRQQIRGPEGAEDAARVQRGRRTRTGVSARHSDPARAAPCRMGSLARQYLGDQLPGDRTEAHAHHRVPGGKGEIRAFRSAPDVRHPVRRTRPQAAPRRDAVEIRRLELRIVLRRGGDDAAHAHRIDLLVEAGDLHRSGEAQRARHRRHRDARFGQDGADFRQLARLRQRQAVALAGLHRDLQAQFAREQRRPRAAAEHELVRFDLVAARVVAARICRSPLDAPAGDLGVPDELGALRPRHRSCSWLTKRSGREMTVLRKVHGAGDVHAHAGIERGHLRPASSASASMPSARPNSAVRISSSQRVRGPAQHQQALLDEAEVASRQRGQLVEAAVARAAEIAQQRRGAANVFRRGRAPELEAPVEEIPRQARLDVERRRGIPHPLETERHHARRGQRHEVARHEHPGVLERAAVALRGIAVDDRHAPAAARAVIRDRQADDAATDDDDAHD